MNDPQRLRDDPDFNALTDHALADEPLALGPYDLPGLREKVIRGDSPSLPGSRWPSLVGISGLTAAFVSVAFWALLPMRPGIPPLHPTPPPEELVVGSQQLPERLVLMGSPSSKAPSDGGVARPFVGSPLPSADSAPVATPNVEASPPLPPGLEPTAPPSPQLLPPSPRRDLQAELADYNRALDASDAQRWAEARERYAAYLELWPEGRLRNEARLGLLASLVKSERPAEAEVFAARLLTDPSLSHRSIDIHLLRAEALVKLERCEEALQSLEGLRRNPRSNALRATCRRMKR